MRAIRTPVKPRTRSTPRNSTPSLPNSDRPRSRPLGSAIRHAVRRAHERELFMDGSVGEFSTACMARRIDEQQASLDRSSGPWLSRPTTQKNDTKSAYQNAESHLQDCAAVADVAQGATEPRPDQASTECP